jgi:hypothetical protein
MHCGSSSELIETLTVVVGFGRFSKCCKLASMCKSSSDDSTAGFGSRRNTSTGWK